MTPEMEYYANNQKIIDAQKKISPRKRINSIDRSEHDSELYYKRTSNNGEALFTYEQVSNILTKSCVICLVGI